MGTLKGIVSASGKDWDLDDLRTTLGDDKSDLNLIREWASLVAETESELFPLEVHSLPETITVGNLDFDVEHWRMELAIALGEPRSQVPDSMVLGVLLRQVR
jgi:hypothetical protein